MCKEEHLVLKTQQFVLACDSKGCQQQVLNAQEKPQVQTKPRSDKQCFSHIISLYAKAISTFLENKKEHRTFFSKFK